METEALSRSIAEIQLVLSESKKATDHAVLALDSFSARVKGLEKEMEPINTLTERLLLSRENIDETLSHFDRIEDYFQTYGQVEPIINSIKAPFQSLEIQREYIKATGQLSESLIFIKTYSQKEKSAVELRQKMEDLEKHCMETLSNEFSRLTAENAPTKEDYIRSRNSPVAFTFVFPETVIVKLNEIAKCMESYGYSTLYEHSYQNLRSQILCAVIETVADRYWPQQDREADDGGNRTIDGTVSIEKLPPLKKLASSSRLTSHKSERFDLRSHVAASKSISGYSVSIGDMQTARTSRLPKKNETYTADDAGVIHLLEVCVTAFQQERKIARKIHPIWESPKDIFLSAMFLPCDMLADYCVNAAVPDFFSTYQADERLLGFADVYTCIQRVVPMLESILYSPLSEGEAKPPTLSYIEEIRDFWTKLCFEQTVSLEDNLCRTSTKIAKDGTVHPTSTRTLNFLRRLASFEEEASLLFFEARMKELEAEGVDRTRSQYSSKSVLRDTVIDILDVLKTSLEVSAKSVARGSPALGWLFLVNNYHYIYDGLTGDQFLSQLLGEEELLKRQDLYLQAKAIYIETITKKVNNVLDSPPDIEIGARNEPIGRSKQTLKEIMSVVNKWISDVHSSQRKLSVPNQDLRVELRWLIREKVSRKYKSLFEIVNKVKLSKKNKEKYIVYDPERFDMIISQFYEASEILSS